MLDTISSSLGGLSPSCRESVRLMSEAKHHKLPLLQRTGLRIHVFLCRFCRRYSSHVDQLSHAHPKPPAQPTPLAQDAKERFKRALANADGKEQS
jgi:hypothetical protein